MQTDILTTNSGMPIADNTSSLTAGPRGPVLLEDFHMLEKLAQFSREKIPERIVHARGAAAFGEFKVTGDISEHTSMELFGSVGNTVPVQARFSMVIHPRGSPEALRDVRGFSVRFQTQQGNWDMVGNNFPVFFIRDGMKFPDLVHSLKPSPKTHEQVRTMLMTGDLPASGGCAAAMALTPFLMTMFLMTLPGEACTQDLAIGFAPVIL
jgi:catalase